jgi:hypothetical protein
LCWRCKQTALCSDRIPRPDNDPESCCSAPDPEPPKEQKKDRPDNYNKQNKNQDKTKQNK